MPKAHPHHPRTLRPPSTRRHFSAYTPPAHTPSHSHSHSHPHPHPHPHHQPHHPLAPPPPRAMSASCIPPSPSAPSTHMCARCAPPPPGTSLSALSPASTATDHTNAPAVHTIPPPPPPPPPLPATTFKPPGRPSLFARARHAGRRRPGVAPGPDQYPTTVSDNHHHHHHHRSTGPPTTMTKHRHHHHHLHLHHPRYHPHHQHQHLPPPQHRHRPAHAVYNATTVSARAAELAGGSGVGAYMYDVAERGAGTQQQHTHQHLQPYGYRVQLQQPRMSHNHHHHYGPSHKTKAGHGITGGSEEAAAVNAGTSRSGRGQASGTAAGNDDNRDAKLTHFHQHHHHHLHHDAEANSDADDTQQQRQHHDPNSPSSPASPPPVDPLAPEGDPTSTSSSSSSSSLADRMHQQHHMQDQDVSALFEKGTNTSTTSAVIQQTHVVSPGVAAPVPGVRKRTSAATRVVVKRRVIRGSSVLRHATEADIDAYLEADCHREMVRCDATSVNIVPSLPASTPEAGFLQHEQQQQQALQHQGALQCQTPPELCATCTPSYPAKRSMSGGCAAGVIGTRITWRVPQLLTTWGLVGSGGSCTGYGSNSSSSNNNNNSNKDLDSHMIDIAPYAAMDEAKAISMFLKQVRMYRRDVMTSMQRAVTDDIGAHTAAQRLGDHDDVGDDDEWRQQRPQRQHRKKYGALLSNDLFSCTGGGKYSSRGRPSPMSVRSFSADDQFAIQSQQQNRHISATNATATAHPTAGTDAASNTTKTGSLGAPVCDGDGMPTSTPAATADDDSRYKYCGTGLGFGGGGVRVVTKPGRPAQMRSVSDLHGGRVGMPLAAGAVSAEACSVAAAARAVRNQRSNADRPHTPPAACQPPPPPRRTTDVVAGKDNEENGGQTQSSSDRRHKRKSVEYDEEEEEDEEDEEECFAHQQVLTRQTRLEVDTGFGAGMGAFGHRRGYMAACKTAGATKQVVGRGLQQHVRAQHDGRQMDGGLLQRLRSFRKRCGEEW